MNAGRLLASHEDREYFGVWARFASPAPRHPRELLSEYWRYLIRDGQIPVSWLISNVCSPFWPDKDLRGHMEVQMRYGYIVWSPSHEAFSIIPVVTVFQVYNISDVQRMTPNYGSCGWGGSKLSTQVSLNIMPGRFFFQRILSMTKWHIQSLRTGGAVQDPRAEHRRRPTVS